MIVPSSWVGASACVTMGGKSPVAEHTMRLLPILAAGLCCASALAQTATQPVTLTTYDRAQAHMILHQVRDDIRKYYYDPSFHGVDLDKRAAAVDAAIDKAATKTDTFFLIAAFASLLDDSHTFFVPPSRMNRMDRGYRMEVVGEACFITQVRPKTDAAAKLHPGDRVISINGYNAKRESYELLTYLFETLVPVPELRMELEDPQGHRRTEIVKAQFKQGKALTDLSDEDTVDYKRAITDEQNYEHHQRERLVKTDKAVVWKMPDFEGTDDAINSAFSEARQRPALILDLRGNPGGSVDTLKLTLQHVMDHEVPLWKRISRKETKDEVVKGGGFGNFKGQLIVLIDQRSSSAAEIFAKVVQLEHRGVVLGDRSAGAVMQSRQYNESIGQDTVVFYTVSVTSANLIMSDGKSLEKTGVVPDETVLPTAKEISEGADPVLAKAMQMAGMTTSAEEAGKLFPFEWPKL